MYIFECNFFTSAAGVSSCLDELTIKNRAVFAQHCLTFAASVSMQMFPEQYAINI